MSKDPLSHDDQQGRTIPLSAKLLLCLWIAVVVFVFFVLFFPADYLYFSEQVNMRGWLLSLRDWIQPFFHEIQ